jgi:excisionase family DNA binding protein
MEDKTLDLKAAADFFKISRWTVYQLTRKNKIPCHRPIGWKLVFFKSELEAFLRGEKKQHK